MDGVLQEDTNDNKIKHSKERKEGQGDLSKVIEYKSFGECTTCTFRHGQFQKPKSLRNKNIDFTK
jgi:hypothetical protein